MNSLEEVKRNPEKQESISMIIIRPIEKKDLDAYEKLASLEATIGITNLPKDRAVLSKKIENSVLALEKEIIEPSKEEYIFVIEDLNTKEIGGTSAIKSKMGVTNPIYFYRIESYAPKPFPNLSLSEEMHLLRPITYLEGPSEICSLFLLPEFRREGLGRLLSLSRLLFIANFPHRFEEIIIAEMRGIIDKEHQSPFWNGLGRHFLDVDFDDILHLQFNHPDFTPHILPKYPIYIDLLPKETQEAIGKTHPDTKPALNMLLKEGFNLTQEIDVFDGGPKISALRNQIRTIKESQTAEIAEIEDTMESSEQVILCNTLKKFKACYGKIKKINDNKVYIPVEIAQALNLKKGDFIRYVSSR